MFSDVLSDTVIRAVPGGTDWDALTRTTVRVWYTTHGNFSKSLDTLDDLYNAIHADLPDIDRHSIEVDMLTPPKLHAGELALAVMVPIDKYKEWLDAFEIEWL